MIYKKQKPYESEKWLRLKYLRQRMTVDEIAELCKVQPMTIYRAINKFGLKR